MDKLNEFLKANPSIDESQMLSEDSQELIQGGDCDSCTQSCKKKCSSTQKTGSGAPGGPGGLPGVG